MKHTIILTIAALLSAAALAATPPDRMHYQGVLRDAAGDPLDGSYDMVFKLFSEETLGDEILLDRHLAVNLQAVEVADGLFAAGIGDGEILDGSGPGTYASLAEVFAAHGDVWLEVQIGSETLTPRSRVAAAGYALNAARFDGRPAADFIDGTTTTQFKSGKLVVGQASGVSGYHGIQAFGGDAGGYMADTNDTGRAYLGSGDRGIEAYGDDMGGYFQDTSGTGYAYVAYGNTGIWGVGTSSGGYFVNDGGGGYAYVGFGDRGIEARGTEAGGYFTDYDSSGRAYAAFGHYGLQGFGDTAGGYFKDDNNSGYAFVGYGDRGIQAYGSNAGGYFNDTNSSSYAYAGYGSYKIWGSGAVSFVQNHPEDASKVVVYHAPESSEVAVYTRGSARLEEGAAAVPLDATFAWVTNPDLGLTAHLTSRGGFCPLYVEAVTTDLLSVRSDDPACGESAFDYMVWGLRIGFEESTPVQPKEREAHIPSMEQHAAFVRADPVLGRYTAQSRFAAIAKETFGVDEVDLSAAHSLRSQIHVFDPATDPPVVADVDLAAPSVISAASAPIREDAPPAAASPDAETVGESDGGGAVVANNPSRMPVGEPVAAGDLLVMDESGGLLMAKRQADSGVVGIAGEDSAPVDGGWRVAVASYGIATLKVDADLGPIRRGDLLVSSPTPGHAMRAYGEIPGTVIAKALEPLEAGQEAIRVLITPR